MEKQKIYLDYAATTPVDEKVFEAMRPYFCERFGNANSGHSFGHIAENAVSEARRVIAGALNADKKEIYFTSGGTEANNWAVKCLGRPDSKRRRILVSAIEHPSVMQAAKQTEAAGYKLEIIPVGADGAVDITAFEKMLGEDVMLAAVMYANNETGVIQPVRQLAAAAHKCGAFFHSDAVQALGSMEIDVKKLGVDSLAVSAHKIYGPKGAGALYLKEGIPSERLIAGGHQEREMRGGTTNVPAVVGFAAAVKLNALSKKEENAEIYGLKRRFIQSIMSGIIGAKVNGDVEISVPGIVNIQFPGADGKKLLKLLDIAGVVCSAGAACSAGSIESSYVLGAMGLDKKAADSSLRFSLGKFTQEKVIDEAAQIIVDTVKNILLIE